MENSVKYTRGEDVKYIDAASLELAKRLEAAGWKKEADEATTSEEKAPKRKAK